MKKLIFLLIFSLFSPLVVAFSQQDLVLQLQKPSNLQGQFSQQRFLNGLTKPMTTQGDFVLLKNQGLLWQMKKPFENQLRVKADGISQWNGSQWVSSQQLGQSEQIKLFLGLLSGDVAALSSQFDLQLNGTEKAWQLSLVPNTLLMKQIFDNIEIRGDLVVKSIEIREKQGDRTLIRFEQIQQDQPLSAFAQSALQK
ncbi:Outer membrane lipoprotein carrier protein LolA [Bibersteinia trehalosi USDA-ARS-USMARC-188]|uniref:Outer membrane lipoprotein carrier protein LolA n=2 Tax=Bibersteinia trehalosi TaxID=47735 RepID=A0A4V7I708_BIBTR|nr:outer membrane lipoprotein carrier protein LolA [Bibersteinia trehalosi]AGH39462.1 Outer membrane lipoprotein carrier protein LolA [Bibersteinia trehalosi USDA-ARS-USMARC-192]AHG80793.1 Outer membrane lipoprotein carrier protein LolA [Bibersteinia trehalosi USDA-ARS-USMARC-188]AHG82942.1 Outer membrane lipoprotein carrier protein LolA [Bibersteinia trehalosi USDA-ARS-USMARC-189]